MMKRVLIGLVVIVAVVAVARLVYVAPYPKPVGDDRIRAYSPDSAFVGTATTYEAVPFWGGRYRFVEFAIARPDLTPVRSLVVIPPRNEPVYDYAEVGGLRWASDSLGIEADLFGAEVRLQLLESDAYRPWRPNPASQPTPGSSALPVSPAASTLPDPAAVLPGAAER